MIQSPKKTQRVLHLSDIHVDRDYAIGSEADCKVFIKNSVWLHGIFDYDISETNNSISE